MAERVRLEPAAQQFADATANPPYLFQIPVAEGREAVDKVQDNEVPKLECSLSDFWIKDEKLGEIGVRVLRPNETYQRKKVILYIHGAGWVFGNEHTHHRLLKELANGADAAVVFPKYSPSPEAKYPRALEECYAVARWIVEHGAEEEELDAGSIVIAGDSVGGNMAAALTLMAKERGGPAFKGQVLFYPVTDASFDTESYRQFATGYFLRRDAMQWFWDQYTTDPAERAQITASPLRASLDQLRGLPPALVITAEADVLRDEGEAYAEKLRQAGVDVTAKRFDATIHDFVMLNALAETEAKLAAIELATAWIRERLGS